MQMGKTDEAKTEEGRGERRRTKAVTKTNRARRATPGLAGLVAAVPLHGAFGLVYSRRELFGVRHTLAAYARWLWRDGKAEGSQHATQKRT